MTELRLWRDDVGLSYGEIAIKAKVNASSVYRVFDGSLERRQYGPALRSICKIAKIEIEQGAARSGDVPPLIRDAVMRTWDGTDEHAGRLAAAISAVGALIRQALSSK